jgi:phosphatidylethanolamine/phosphatidyl-N-methylethanolamine N-methyltransferase
VSGTARVLELASGTGLVSEAIAPVVGELLATDYAAGMVEKTRARVGHLPNVRCEVRDLYALGEPEGSFDAVVAANVLHLLPDLPGGLAAMRRVLRPGGRLVVPTYCHAQDARARLVSAALAVVSFPGRRRFDLATLRVAVEEAGFAVEQEELIPGLLPVGFVAGVVTPT